MKFIKIKFRTNDEEGRICIRPNKITAFKEYGKETKLFIEGLPNAIAVSKTFDEIEKELTSANIRVQVPRVPKENRTKKSDNGTTPKTGVLPETDEASLSDGE
jgi:hypothetical protein